MNQELIDIIVKHFPGLYEKELQEAIAREGTLKQISEGEIIMDIGEYIKTMPLMIKGSIKVLRVDDNSNELLMYYLNKGETCATSLTCCIQHKPSEVRAVAEEDCTIIAVPVKFMDQWTKEYKSWMNYLMLTYRQRFDELLYTIDSIAFTNLDDRLLKYLKEKTKSAGNSKITKTHQDIAYELNSSREVISRLLKQLEKRGTVRLSRNTVEVVSLV